MDTSVLFDVQNILARRGEVVAGIEHCQEKIDTLRQKEAQTVIRQALGKASEADVRGVKNEIAEEERKIEEYHNRLVIFDKWRFDIDTKAREAELDQLVATYNADVKAQRSNYAAARRWLDETPPILAAYGEQTLQCQRLQSKIADLAGALGKPCPSLEKIEMLPGLNALQILFTDHIFQPLRMI